MPEDREHKEGDETIRRSDSRLQKFQMALSILGTSAWVAGERLMTDGCNGFGAAHTSSPGTNPSLSANSCSQWLSVCEQILDILLPGLKGLAVREEKGPIFHGTS